MKYTHSASAVIDNNKGGKKSDVKLNITIVTGGHQHVWGLQGIIKVHRNNHPFYVETTVKSSDVPKFLHYLMREVGRKIEMEYERECGCNVDTGPIINWINQEVDKFAAELKKE